MIGPAADDFRDSPATDSNPHDSQGSTTRTKAFNNRFLRKKALLRRMNEPSWQARRQHRDNPRADEPGAENREAHSRNPQAIAARSEEHTSELQSPMRRSSAAFCLKHKKNTHITITI